MICAAALLSACGAGMNSGGPPSQSAGELAPTITAQPQDQSVVAPATATFNVTASGTSPLSYQWRENGSAVAGAVGPSYTTPATAGGDTGSAFTVMVSNQAGTVTSNTATLTVNTEPSIITQPQSQTAIAPAAVSFMVEATGTAPLAYQWAENGTSISGATTSAYSVATTSAAESGASFTVTVSNNFGSVTSAPAVLTVRAPAPPGSAGPVLIGGDPRDQSVVAGTSATFSANAIGSPPMTYQWSQNGSAIPGATSAQYTTPPTAISDNGSTFTVTIANDVNVLTSPAATLTVTSSAVAPAITAQPQNTQIVPGNAATFRVFASGTAPLSYQWFKNGAPIESAAGTSYSTPPATVADNKSDFTVTVSNGAGSTDSAGATLFVNATVVGLAGYRLLGAGYPLPFAPSDIIGVQYNFQVVTDSATDGDIIFGFNYLATPGSNVLGYDIETNLYSWVDTYTNGGCATFPPLGSYVYGQASLRDATADYPFNQGVTPAVGSAISTSDPVNWPVQTYLVDNISNLWKSDSMSQFNINGRQGSVAMQRGNTLTDVSSFERCGISMLATTYRVWTVTAQVAGEPAVVNQFVVPDADARFLEPAQALQFASEFLAQPGTLTVQYWDLQYMRASNPVWTSASEFMTNPIYDGDGQAFGVRVVTVDGHDRLEISNVAGNSYLPANTPFVIVP